MACIKDLKVMNTALTESENIQTLKLEFQMNLFGVPDMDICIIEPYDVDY